MPDAIAQFVRAKYLNLESFRKTGVGVRTPVWFAHGSESGSNSDISPNEAIVFYIYSAPDAGKVKRIRNNPRVRVAPCDMRGNLRGAWVDAAPASATARKPHTGRSCCGASTAG